MWKVCVKLYVPRTALLKMLSKWQLFKSYIHVLLRFISAPVHAALVNYNLPYRKWVIDQKNSLTKWLTMTSCYSIVKNGIYLNKAKTNISYLVIIIDLREKCLVLKWGLLLSEYMNRLSKSVSQYFSNHHLVFVLSNKNMVFF